MVIAQRFILNIKAPFPKILIPTYEILSFTLNIGYIFVDSVKSEQFLGLNLTLENHKDTFLSTDVGWIKVF